MVKLALPLFIGLLLVTSVSAFEYNIPYYSEGQAGATGQTNISAFYGTPATSTHLYLTSFGAFNVTGTYDTYFYSPLSTVYALSSGTITGNTSCKNLGTSNKSYSANFVEDKTVLVHTATYGKSYAKAHYYVTSPNRYFTISDTAIDSEDFRSNVLGVQGCNLGGGGGATVVSAEFNDDNVGDCLDNAVDKIGETYTAPGSCGVGSPEGFYFLLFNSSEGNLTYYSTWSGTVDATTRHIIYKFDTPATVTTLCSASGSCSGVTTLDKNELYVYAVNGIYALSQTKNTPVINLTLDIATPNYLCGDWSDCDETTNQQQRVCVDENGLQPDFIDIESCTITVLENATLGFEAFSRVDDVYKCIPSFSYLDPYELTTTYRDTPLNWTIGETSIAKRDFLKITEEWATEGSRSLKMWYIPPKNWEIEINSTGYPIDCSNATIGTAPFVYRNISNTSFSVYYNVTFPAENMILRFDVKGCDSQVYQHTSVNVNVPFTDISIYEIYPELCYASSCNGTPNSRYVFNILDTVTGLSVLGYPYFETASINTADPIIIDLSNLGLIAGREYTLVFSVYPENLDDNTGNCIYFDNVRYEVIEESFVDEFLNGECESQCVGDDFYEATLLNNGECSVKKVEYGCLGDEIRTSLNAGENICVDSDTLIYLDEKTKLPKTINCDYGCQNGACNTELEEDTSSSLYDCIDIGFCSYLGSFGFFLSMFMIINYIAIGLGVGITILTQGKQIIVSILSMLIVILGSWGAGLYPVEIGVVIILVVIIWASLLISKKVLGDD